MLLHSSHSDHFIVTHWGVILQQPTEFHPKWTTMGGVMISYVCFKTPQINYWFRVWWQLVSIEAEIYVCTKFRNDRWIYVQDITTIYSLLLRCNYFRFLKTNGRHVGFLLPVLILPFHRHRHRHVILRWPTKFHPNQTIGIRDITWFTRWQPSSCWIWCREMIDHPQRIVVGFNVSFKFWVAWICSFGDIAIFRFWHLGLKLHICADFLGCIFPQLASPCHSNCQKASPWAEPRRLSYSACVTVPQFDL